MKAFKTIPKPVGFGGIHPGIYLPKIARVIGYILQSISIPIWYQAGQIFRKYKYHHL
jgi:hypothetical protein